MNMVRSFLPTRRMTTCALPACPSRVSSSGGKRSPRFFSRRRASRSVRTSGRSSVRPPSENSTRATRARAHEPRCIRSKRPCARTVHRCRRRFACGSSSCIPSNTSKTAGRGEVPPEERAPGGAKGPHGPPSLPACPGRLAALAAKPLPFLPPIPLPCSAEISRLDPRAPREKDFGPECAPRDGGSRTSCRFQPARAPRPAAGSAPRRARIHLPVSGPLPAWPPARGLVS